MSKKQIYVKVYLTKSEHKEYKTLCAMNEISMNEDLHNYIITRLRENDK